MCDSLKFAVDKSEVDILKYETKKLEEAFCLCLESKKNGNETERVLFLEAFLLHARNLIDFLDGKEKYSDDLTVKDFKDKNGVKIEKIDFDLEKDIKMKIDKHCCHMTKKRLNNKYGWDIKKIKNKIEQGLFKFEELTGLDITIIPSAPKNVLIIS